MGETRNEIPRLREAGDHSLGRAIPSAGTSDAGEAGDSAREISTAGTIACRPADQKPWKIRHHGRPGSGTASPTQYANGLFNWPWPNPSYRPGSWPRASPIRQTTL